MKIFIRVKSAGKRRPVLELAAYELPDALFPCGAETLIELIVRDNVRKYNAKAVDAALFKYLSADEVEERAEIGKVSFGDRKNENDQDEEAAVRNALQSFRDGIFRMLANEEEVEPENSARTVSLREGDVLTFIRLVMLAGRIW